MDPNNTVVHHWTHARTGGYSCYLMPDGTLLRPAGVAASTSVAARRQAWCSASRRTAPSSGKYTYSTTTYRSHHDIRPMPNSSILLIAWETRTAQQCVDAGLDHSASLWPDHIIECSPPERAAATSSGNWRVGSSSRDFNPAKSNYGVVGDHPELLDINVVSTSGDWLHVNSVSYNPDLDQIVFSSHYSDELYVIDHSTTTAQAAGHSGGTRRARRRFPLPLGRPSIYRAAAQVFDVVHCVVDSHRTAGRGEHPCLQQPRDRHHIGGGRDHAACRVSAFAEQRVGTGESVVEFHGFVVLVSHLGSCQRLRTETR
ncbi:MAG: aryl-sulfate sulfotransferase [Ignavibacteria bacterium]|nr:aryl-sulfate sulfotransferase [Ignavibacteria bacterium]